MLICCCYVDSGAVHTGRIGQCVEQRGCQVCCHGARSSECYHEVKQSTFKIILGNHSHTPLVKDKLHLVDAVMSFQIMNFS